MNLLQQRLFIVFVVLSLFSTLKAQTQKDKIQLQEVKPGFYQNYILKGVEDFKAQQSIKKPEYVIKADLTGKNFPKSVKEFTTIYANEPISQGNAGTCWSYSTTSFFEAEVYRQTKQKVKLSEIYTVYWEYVEKARRFVQERGNSHFDQGSQANAVLRMYKLYGIVPYENYTGLKAGQTYHDHSEMVKEMQSYLASVKQTNAWNEETVISTIKAIMNHYIGEPPQKIMVNGKSITPKQYLQDVLKLKLDDYVDFMSTIAMPYWTKGELIAQDNWWHNADYHNVPLDVFMEIIKKAIRNNYSLFIGGDVTEPGFDSWNQVAFVPTFDIPSEYIDENSRYMRVFNKSTTDDHGMHLIGYLEKDGKDWYLIKDSGSGSRNCGKESENFGYYFVHEDYIKLKINSFFLHKDAAKEVLKKFN